jgi:uncharacterized membrane protein YfcA
MTDWPDASIAVLAVLFIGVSKAGFGGGLGMLTTPLTVLAFGRHGHPATYAIGILLPLLCAGDAFSLYHYWGRWERKNLKYLLPGVVLGVLAGVRLLGMLSARPDAARELNIVIGWIAIGFVGFQLVKKLIFRAGGVFAPNHLVGIPCGIGAGITSTFAHGAGPVITLFLIPQKLPKEIYVGTTVLVFTWINWLKLPFFIVDRSMVDWPILAPRALITAQTLRTSLILFPLVPVGVWLGVWLNRRVSEKLFIRAVYVLTFLAGLELVFNFDLARPFR